LRKVKSIDVNHILDMRFEYQGNSLTKYDVASFGRRVSLFGGRSWFWSYGRNCSGRQYVSPKLPCRSTYL